MTSAYSIRNLVIREYKRCEGTLRSGVSWRRTSQFWSTADVCETARAAFFRQLLDFWARVCPEHIYHYGILPGGHTIDMVNVDGLWFFTGTVHID